MKYSVAKLQSQEDRWIWRRLIARNPPSSEKFLEAVYDGLEHAINQLEKNPQFHQEESEDAISCSLMDMMNTAGFRASSDTRQGGHVDLTVVSGDDTLTWIGEAKIWKGAEYVACGLKQLFDRYVQGGEPSVGLLLYIQQSDAGVLLDKWCTKLRAESCCALVSVKPREGLRFESQHTCARTSNPMLVRHFGISLWRAYKACDSTKKTTDSTKKKEA